MEQRPLTVAVVGATGAVGTEMVSVLDQRQFPVGRLVPLASERSLGHTVEFRGMEVPVEVLGPDSFAGVDLVLFSAGAEVSRTFAPRAVEAGAVVIDNSSAFRDDPKVPLVVPEVNAHTLSGHRGLIANPNCSTIQLVVALKPLADAARLRSVVVATYQSASGAGRRGMDELMDQTVALLNQRDVEVRVHARRLAFNVVPQIGSFGEDGFCVEEWKIMREAPRILGLPDLKVAATAVRVPVFVGHSEAVAARFGRPLSVVEAREVLRTAPGVVLMDDPSAGVYPTVLDATEQDPVFVGRLRPDPTDPCGLLLWVVADNLRKGAALNAVQIAEALLEGDLLRVP